MNSMFFCWKQHSKNSYVYNNKPHLKLFTNISCLFQLRCCMKHCVRMQNTLTSLFPLNCSCVQDLAFRGCWWHPRPLAPGLLWACGGNWQRWAAPSQPPPSGQGREPQGNVHWRPEPHTGLPEGGAVGNRKRSQQQLVCRLPQTRSKRAEAGGWARGPAGGIQRSSGNACGLRGSRDQGKLDRQEANVHHYTATPLGWDVDR